MPLVAAVDMGYGHLRAAQPLADALGTTVAEVDRPPWTAAHERTIWRLSRLLYEALSRASQVRVVGSVLRRVLDLLTHVPARDDWRDRSAVTAAVRVAEHLIASGFARDLVGKLRESGAALLTTFYLPALVADHACLEPIVCVVTDADINRVWTPRHGKHSRIVYCVASERAARRLVSYGIRRNRIELTGFPLPLALTRSAAAYAARATRLEPCASDSVPLLTFAVGGAGAQVSLARAFLPSLAMALREGRLRIALVAGTRATTAQQFTRMLRALGLDDLPADRVRVLHAESTLAYLRQFDALMAVTDVLWTKPSELVFFSALGMPLILAPAVGAHERANAEWVLERGAALAQRDPRHAREWIEAWLHDGTFARLAAAGYSRGERRGTQHILDVVGGRSLPHTVVSDT